MIKVPVAGLSKAQRSDNACHGQYPRLAFYAFDYSQNVPTSVLNPLLTLMLPLPWWGKKNSRTGSKATLQRARLQRETFDWARRFVISGSPTWKPRFFANNLKFENPFGRLLQSLLMKRRCIYLIRLEWAWHISLCRSNVRMIDFWHWNFVDALKRPYHNTKLNRFNRVSF